MVGGKVIFPYCTVSGGEDGTVKAGTIHCLATSQLRYGVTESRPAEGESSEAHPSPRSLFAVHGQEEDKHFSLSPFLQIHNGRRKHLYK